MTGASLQYYTDRAEDALAQTVRGIRGQHDEFGTDYLGSPAQDKDWGMCVRLVAWQQPGTDTWHIDRYTMLGAATGYAVKKENETKSPLCFFDALEYCASFQMMQKEIGRVAFPVPDADDVVLFGEAAKAAGQVIDADGRVRPCAFGRILEPGLFSRDDIAIARKTRVQKESRELAVRSSSALEVLRTAESVAPQTDDLRIVALVRQKDEVTRKRADLVKIYTNAVHAVVHHGTNMIDAFDSALQRDFKGDRDILTISAIGIVSVLTVGVLPAIAIKNRNPNLIPVKGFHLIRNDFLKAVQSLPDAEERVRLQDFARTVEVAFEMERAAALVKDPLKRTARDVEKALGHVAVACQKAGYNEADTQRIKRSLTDGHVKHKQFYNEVAVQWDPFLVQNFSTFTNHIAFNWGEFYQAVKGVVDQYDGSTNAGLRSQLSNALLPLYPKLDKSVNHLPWDNVVANIATATSLISKSSLVGEIYAQLDAGMVPS